MKITPDVKTLIAQALQEDSVKHDFTTFGLGVKDLKIKAALLTQQDGILCGFDVFKEVFKACGEVKWSSEFKDGMCFKKGYKITHLEARAGTILAAERAALNFLSHLSGVATFTNTFVKLVKQRKIKIYDTRKTTPGLRGLEKYAVKIGGGYNHRFDLSGSMMIKDNHINIFQKEYLKDDYIIQMVKRLKKKYPHRALVLEVHTLGEWRQAMQVNPDVVMLDNWKPDDIETALKMLKKRLFEVEISGNIDFDKLKKVLSLGIDRISLGRITHSAPIVDFSLEVN
ncbi:MAG: carboxylating nicotinate-nucleotide diphosphorylase [Candidatus Kaelpia aquatica]|nr:carboxylating nicotinate-nucleotide diphosphorylase [Candidatus Kaelpia aquatica]